LICAVLLPAQKAVHDAVAPLPGTTIAYIDSGGSGVPVVFLHAATGTTQSWEHQIPAFTAAGYRLIAYDRRGWGRTVIDPAGPQPGTAADDLEALIVYLKIDRFHLVGTAGGGLTALDYAISYPKRLKSLVVVCTIGGVTDPAFVELGRKLRPAQFDALPPHLRELGPTYRAADPAGVEKWLAIEKSSRPEVRPQAQPLKNPLTLSLLQSISTPTLLIAGGADMYAPPAVMQQFADRIKGSKLVVIPDSGHSAYWENPARFNQEVLRFLMRHNK
jgi:pimeloyl-ACP methyl ester carboxylesterase